MLLKPCARCKKLIPYGRSYCDDCQPVMDEIIAQRKERYKKERNKRYNANRDPKYTAFYNSKDWHMLRDKYKQDKGFRCERCRNIATQVHHIKPIQTDDGWNLRLDYNNLELLCTNCHNERHERKYYGRLKAKMERAKALE